VTTVIALTNRKSLYLPDAIASLNNLTGWERLVIVDDSGDDAWRDELGWHYPDAEIVPVAQEPAGYTRAMHVVWFMARQTGGPIFFLEEDFTIDRPVSIADLKALLDADVTLAQVALQRQAWYRVEKSHGLIGAQKRRGHQFTDHGTHLTHTACFTGNPCLIPERTFTVDWPGGTWTEDAMTDRLTANGMRFAYFGHDGDEYVTHHGRKRAESSHGY